MMTAYVFSGSCPLPKSLVDAVSGVVVALQAGAGKKRRRMRCAACGDGYGGDMYSLLNVRLPVDVKQHFKIK